MGKNNKTPEYLAKFPTGKVPAFENEKVNLIESNAIAYYGKYGYDASVNGVR
jgi:elongation factor 1-gamma